MISILHNIVLNGKQLIWTALLLEAQAILHLSALKTISPMMNFWNLMVMKMGICIRKCLHSIFACLLGKNLVGPEDRQDQLKDLASTRTKPFLTKDGSNKTKIEVSKRAFVRDQQVVEDKQQQTAKRRHKIENKRIAVDKPFENYQRIFQLRGNHGQ